MLKIRTIRSAAFIFAAGVAMLFFTSDANAQRCGYRGGFGPSRGISFSFGGGGYGGRGVRVSLYSPYQRSVWYDTRHYHAPRVIRYGRGLDYIPGRYHGGHWHY